jgi:VIT1/CCC1 family predicted Fe2+/Mn2+ transporter
MINSHTKPAENYDQLAPYIGAYRRIPRPDENRVEVWEKQQSKGKETTARFLMAAFGGLMLIVPMLIMSYHASHTKSIVTSSLFVLFVAFILAAFSEASGQEILGATAAYAAVLVVFVGTTTPST